MGVGSGSAHRRGVARGAVAAAAAALVAGWVSGCAAGRGPAPKAVPAPTRSWPELDRRFETTRRFLAPEARQGVAVGGAYFYAIGNRSIAKHDKRTGERLATWREREDGPIVHLNSGIVIGERLYAAHSNYPGVPMVSSIEIFDAETLAHVGTHSFGVFAGSATWVDRHEGFWWVAFANYEGRGGQAGRGPAWTSLVRFDDAWRPTGGYVFPPEVVERFGTRSNSGGAWGPDGNLYATGHDAAEVYVLRTPRAGSVLELVEVVAVDAEGQGIAWDRREPGMLYTIIKRRREVVVSRLGSRGAR